MQIKIAAMQLSLLKELPKLVIPCKSVRILLIPMEVELYPIAGKHLVTVIPGQKLGKNQLTKLE